MIKRKEGYAMIAFVYDAIFGYIKLFFYDVACTFNFKKGGESVKVSIGFAWLRRLRVRHLEYWHPG